MIGFLRGKIVVKQPPELVLDVRGVGYSLELPMSSFYGLEPEGNEVIILTHMHVREDAMLLFGFVTEAERTLFRLLLKVNGVGAKMALAILSTMSVTDFCSCVSQEDSMSLTKVPGVGKKTAERLFIEMRDRIKNSILQKTSISDISKENLVTLPNGIEVQNSAIKALVSLGYKSFQAEKMVNKVLEPNLKLETLIKKALQQA